MKVRSTDRGARSSPSGFSIDEASKHLGVSKQALTALRGIPGAPKTSLQNGAEVWDEVDLDRFRTEVRNGAQIALALSSSIEGDADTKVMQWVMQYAERFAKLWDTDSGLRQRLLVEWTTDREACIAHLRSRWYQLMRDNDSR